eukprot:ANDGO_04296.mRNA.1 hypothetical protein
MNRSSDRKEAGERGRREATETTADVLDEEEQQEVILQIEKQAEKQFIMNRYILCFLGGAIAAVFFVIGLRSADVNLDEGGFESDARHAAVRNFRVACYSVGISSLLCLNVLFGKVVVSSWKRRVILATAVALALLPFVTAHAVMGLVPAGVFAACMYLVRTRKVLSSGIEVLRGYQYKCKKA